jgi:hypothetical protein
MRWRTGPAAKLFGPPVSVSGITKAAGWRASGGGAVKAAYSPAPSTWRSGGRAFASSLATSVSIMRRAPRAAGGWR